MEQFICTQKCPELDYDNRKHCVEDANGYCHNFYQEFGCCPVGNEPKWEITSKDDENV